MQIVNCKIILQYAICTLHYTDPHNLRQFGLLNSDNDSDSALIANEQPGSHSSLQMMKKVYLCLMVVTALTLPVFALTEDEFWENLQVQVLLDQNGFSPGEIDGKLGKNTQKALEIFQLANNLPPTGEIDAQTRLALGKSDDDVLTSYTITAEDVSGPFVEKIPSDFMLKAKLSALHYTSLHEAIAEKFHVNPEVIWFLNPKAELVEGEEILVPNVLISTREMAFQNSGRKEDSSVGTSVAYNPQKQKQEPLTVIVSGSKSDLIVLRNGKVIFYAPITHGGERDPLPIGKQKIHSITMNPFYRYSPELFWDADPSHTKALIKPGPNNPVGVVWIGLTVRHFGLHGTPEPAAIGYTKSHGCVRLTNWDALKLATIVRPGTEVIFQ